MESESNYPQTYTVSGVADSLGIPVNTLRTWCQRGFGPRVANVEASGEWRKYTPEQVAEFAALKRLSAMIELHPAQMAIWDVLDSQAEDWRKAVRNARLQSGPMLIGIAKYRGVEKPWCFFYAGDKFSAFAATMAEPLGASRGDWEAYRDWAMGRQESPLRKGPFADAMEDVLYPVESLLIVDLGPAVSAAMRALK